MGWPARIAIGAFAALLVGLLLWRISSKPSDADTKPGGKNAAARAVPVAVATVEQKDVPLTIDGLGSVTPLATVTIKSLVDGRLTAVGFKEGALVKKGEVLAQVDPRPFQILAETARAAKMRDEAAARNAVLNLQRDITLREQKLIPQQQVDDQQTVVDQAKAAVLLDDAQLDTANLQLDYARITTPIEGVAGIRQVDVGNIVHPADPGGIVLLTQLDPIAVLFTLPQDALPDVSAATAQEGQLDVETYARDGTTLLAKGKLLVVDNQINAATATMRLKATFDNAQHKLWPNQFVKSRLFLSVRKDAIVIPTPAVQRGPQGIFVYVVEDGVAKTRDIAIDTTIGNQTLINKGLKKGEQVVVDGLGQLKPGAKVQIRTPEDASGGGADAAATKAGEGDTGNADKADGHKGGKKKGRGAGEAAEGGVAPAAGTAP